MLCAATPLQLGLQPCPLLPHPVLRNEMQVNTFGIEAPLLCSHYSLIFYSRGLTKQLNCI